MSSIPTRKIFKYLGIFMIVFVLINAGVIYLYFNNKKDETSKIIDAYIVENNYQDLIQEKDTLYDSKQGEYYGRIVFKDEPENRYEVYVINEYFGNVHVIGFDHRNTSITNKNKGKYIDGRFN